MTRPGSQPDDPLSGFPVEAELGRGRWRRTLLRGAAIAGVGVLALLAVAIGVPWLWHPSPTAAAGEASIRIESTPEGARVSSAGREVGVTPLTLTLPAGTHVLRLEHEGASRELLLQVTAGSQVVHHVEMPRPAAVAALGTGGGAAVAPVLAESPPRDPRSPEVGWLSISAPIELQLMNGDALVGSSRMERVMLPATLHRLRLVNASLGFETAITVRVRPGQRVSRGEYIANSGNTGFSSGPHLHFVVLRNAGLKSESVPVSFAGPGGAAVTPRRGQALTAY